MAAFNLIHCKPIWLRAFALILAVLIVSACAQVPITDRSGLHLVPDTELATMSFQEYRTVLEKSQLSTDVRQTAMVREVGMRIAKAAETFLKESGTGRHRQLPLGIQSYPGRQDRQCVGDARRQGCGLYRHPAVYPG